MDIIRMQRRVRRWRQRGSSLRVRLLRDASDPLALDPVLFGQCYRVTKQLFCFLCATLTEIITAPDRNTGISTEVKILTALNFLATGSYQKPVGRDWLAPVSQPTASRCIAEVVEALNNLMHQYIQFPASEEAWRKIKQGFYDKYGMPGVMGCVDGTLISILAPRNHPSEAAFFSRKGTHAINAAIICDSDKKIVAINAKYGGATHDSFVLASWSISSHLEDRHNNGHVGWLLGDSGYPQKPWLMTPVLHATENTPEAHYTNMHVRTRVCVEQCIGLLKSRWRCLLRHRVLHYEPTKCAKIINACAVLHNLCLNDGISIDMEHTDTADEPIGVILQSSADQTTRQQLIQNLWLNR